MKVLQFPLARITLCFTLGIIFAHYVKLYPPSVLLAMSVSFAACCFALYFSGKQSVPKSYFGIAAFCLSFCLGISTLTIHNSYLQKNNYIHYSAGEKSHLLEVVLREKLKRSAYNDRYTAVVKKIDGHQSSGKILLNLRKGNTENHLVIGTRLLVSGKVIKPKKPENPDQFDYAEYLINKSILAQLYVDLEDIKISKVIDRDAFYYSDLLRNRILGNLEKSHFGKTELAVIGALILGQQQEISPEILHDYQFAGAIHILSVSGLHVGFILLFLNFLLHYLPKNRTTSYIKLSIIICSLWGFAVLAGLSPSVIRSVTMFSFVALGMHLKRKTNIFHTLLVSIFLILLFEPSFLFDVGFQLSYVALFFILWVQPLLSAIWTPKNRVVHYFWDILTVSFAAQIGTLPLSIYYFHQFPGLFFVTNLIIIPFLSVIMALGAVVLILAAFNFVPELLSKSLEWSVAILNHIINKIASFEQFIFQDIPFNSYMLLSSYLLIIALVFWFENPNYKKLLLALLALFFFQGSYFSSRWMHQNEQEWIVFNSKKSTLIAERIGEKVTVYSSGGISGNRMIKSYLTANFCHIEEEQPLKNTAYFNSKKILLLDSLSVYPENVSPDVMILRQSPKVNLERVLQSCKPKMIVADATNYKSYVARWKATCNKEKIPFHATAEKGFYKLQ